MSSFFEMTKKRYPPSRQLATSLDHIREIEEKYTVSMLTKHHKRYVALKRKGVLTESEEEEMAFSKKLHTVHTSYTYYKRKVSKLEKSMNTMCTEESQCEGTSKENHHECGDNPCIPDGLNIPVGDFESRRLHPDDICNDDDDVDEQEEQIDEEYTFTDDEELSYGSSVPDIVGKFFFLC